MLVVEELILGLELGQEVIDDALLYMLTKLSRLYEFHLHAAIGSTSTIEQICVMQLEQKISESRFYTSNKSKGHSIMPLKYSSTFFSRL